MVFQPSKLGLQNTSTTPLQKSKTPPKEYPDNDTKLSDGEASVILELWGMQSIPLIAIPPRSTLAWSGSTW